MIRAPAGRTFGLTDVWQCVCVVVLVLTVHCEASGQSGRPLTLISVQPPSLRNRSGAPIPVDVTLDWAGRDLIEGELEATFHAGRSVTAHYRSAALALTTGRQTFRMLFPAMTVPWEGEQLQASYRFRTARGTYELGTRPIIVPAVRQRWMNIGVSDPWDKRDRWTNTAAQGLRFDKLETRTGRPDRSSVSVEAKLAVQPVHVLPEDLPEVPLGWCAYDVVLLAGRGFGEMRQRQLKALEHWVRAGGSVCILPRGEVKSYHVDFLNALAGDGKAFTLTVDGSAVTPAGAGSAVPRHLRCGLGRAVVLMETSESDTVFDAPAWRESVCFLWKIRRDAQNQLLRGGRLDRGDVEHYGVQPIQNASQLVRGLLPRTARLVPLWLIILLLAVFVFAVGPGDYLLLGLVRQRRLTWVLFPVLSIALTLFMVFLSERYMGRTDRRTSVVFVDVGKGGRVLRTNRYELIFAARNKDADTELSHCFFTPLDHRTLSDDSSSYRRYYPTGTTGPPRYSGRMPTHYTVFQTIRKWTPQLNRIFSLEPPAAIRQFNWDALNVSLLQREQARWGGGIEVRSDAPKGGRLIRETLVGTGEFDGHVLLMHAGNSHRTGTSKRRTSYGIQVISRCPFERFIREASSRKGARGLFTIVSQISPTMGDNFEDLAVLDPTDPAQWLVAVITEDGDDTVVYRRLYAGDR